MSAVNPYAPPRAAVADVLDDDGGVQPVRTWSGRGRVGRLRYMAHMTGAYIVMIFAAFAVGLVMGALGLKDSSTPVGVALGLVYLVFAVFKTIQRSHDMDWSGWSALLALIPLVGLIWIFKAGTPGSNRFGAPAPANTLGVKILGLVFPVLGAVGLIVAIVVAVPAYNKYVERAKAQQAK